MTRCRLALCMIVKDEAEIIGECLDSIAPHVQAYVVCDTGSSDETPNRIRGFFAARRVPGEVHHVPWRNFGENRSEALARCDAVADYAWMIDADDVLEGEFAFPERPDADVYSLILRAGDATLRRRQIFRTGIGWRYEGVVHEYPVGPPDAVERFIAGSYHVRLRSIGARNRGLSKAERFERDARLLEQALAEQPDDPRNTFYLGQSYFDAGALEEALAAYERRVELEGWDEERWMARFRIAEILSAMHRPWPEVQQALLDAYAARPFRAEPLYTIAEHYLQAGVPVLAATFASVAVSIPYPERDQLFIRDDVYTWRLPYILALAGRAACRFREGREACRFLLESDHLPEAERADVQRALAEYERIL